MTLEDIRGNCHICKERKSRHLISGKLVDVETWHLVWNGFGMKPSLADTPLVGVDTKKALRPLIAKPLIGPLEEGTESPRYKGRANGIWGGGDSTRTDEDGTQPDSA